MDSSTVSMVHPAVHAPVKTLPSPPPFQPLRVEDVDKRAQRARKRARPGSSPAYSRTKSKRDGKPVKRGKSEAVISYSPVGLPEVAYWHSSIMIPGTAPGAILSSASSASAEQEIEIVVGHETGCEPTVVAPVQPNFLGGETGRAIPNTGLQPPAYTTISPPFAPDFVPDYTTAFQTGFPSCGASEFNFALPLYPYPSFPMYDPDMSSQGYSQEPKVYSDYSEEGIHDFNSLTAMTSPSQPDHAFSMPEGPFYHAFYHDTYTGFPATSLNHPGQEFVWVEKEQASEVSDLNSPEGPASSYSSSSHASRHSSDGDSFLMIPHYTDPLIELDSTLSIKPPPSSSRSPRDESAKKKGGRTGTLTHDQRAQASTTRKIGACIRCSLQRNQCLPDPASLDGPCLTCKQIAQNVSNKVLHRGECVRWKLTSITMFRTGGLNFTKRPGWGGAALKDLGPQDWDDEFVCTIRMTLGYCDAPIELRVRKFKALDGIDKTDRFWLDPQGHQQRTPIAAYALHDIHRARKILHDHITANAYSAVKRYAEENTRVHDLVKETYKAAWNHMRTVNHTTTTTTGEIEAKDLMEDLFKLWFATKNTLGSAWLLGETGTQETLWMTPDSREGYPFPGKISAPRLVCQQFDAINYSTMLNPWRAQFLRNMWNILHKVDPKMFYTMYLVVFVMLHEISSASKDRYWHARMNKTTLRYDMEGFMEELQHGANVVLYCWHYYRRGFNPLDAGWEQVRDEKKKQKKKKKEKMIFSDIDADQMRLMKACADISMSGTVLETPTEKEGWDKLVFDPEQPSPLIWERDLHFVSQMFDDNWSPKRTWSRDWDYGQDLKRDLERHFEWDLKQDLKQDSEEDLTL
ncbi:putative Zn(2)-C6 fungal-type domain-containing protein [Seiridium unicorne]|uniref:Zn(2)-C6 fungal-type domain-containing protein n=1 Tax=Seiridium unicorne TaxID=138068 RepID=A0ABR2UXN0_9PEZI